MSINKVYFNPETQFENTGDLLINKVLVELTGEHGTVYLDDNGKPKNFIADLGIKNVRKLSELTPKSAKKKLLEDLIKYRFSSTNEASHFYYLLIPGHVERKGNADLKKQLKILINLALLRSLGCRIIRVGVSYGNFSAKNKVLEALTSRLYYLLAVRDSASFRFATESGFKNVVVTPDLAWGYESSFPSNETQAKENVVISFRANAYGTKHDQEYIKPVAEQLKYLLSNSAFGESKIIICYQVQFDREASLQLFDFLRKEFKSVDLIDKCLSLSEADKLYSTAKCLFSNRLHVLMLGIRNASLSVPVIEKKDNKKILDIYMDNGMEDYIMDIARTPEENLGKLTEILKSGDTPAKLYQRRSNVNLESLKRVFKEIFEKNRS